MTPSPMKITSSVCKESSNFTLARMESMKRSSNQDPENLISPRNHFFVEYICMRRGIKRKTPHHHHQRNVFFFFVLFFLANALLAAGLEHTLIGRVLVSVAVVQDRRSLNLRGSSPHALSSEGEGLSHGTPF